MYALLGLLQIKLEKSLMGASCNSCLGKQTKFMIQKATVNQSSCYTVKDIFK